VCASSSAFVEAKIVQRLIDKGVKPARARAVGRKVRRAYERQQSERRAAALAGARSIVELRSTTTSDERTP
jgi:hypothetical protein